MYLSRVRFLPTSSARAALLKIQQQGSYASHQLLWRLFTDQSERNFLFREEQSKGFNGPKGLPEFLVLSEIEPICQEQLFQIESKLFKPQLSSGDRLGFRLRANPTIALKSKVPDQKRGGRHDVLMHAKTQAKLDGEKNPAAIQQRMERAAIDWLTAPARLERLGIDFDIEPNFCGYSQQRTYKKTERQPISYSSVDYEGILTIRDPEIFLSQLTAGIGRAKSFGCGLMLIRRV
ncbi:hypothetical protein LH51_12630 [Nitrincola sp. A-D6]|uniref:type I-E CRISPR-associated protein Cas6/Cse3/CasE n=1 Tax=Nitrincola sp. A-D6 TaxID=1545442 RepID=UPI00051FC47A|nr:type I-E CRISPR-associated protein Cas6/Cse3/CasE [Nitrincola sp. A-D6]KGK41710.1 hypothetical protein LH51_12630 [Nitrincola sp. A-D6]